MKNFILFLIGMFLLVGNANATVGWNKSIPATSENPQAISPDVIENNTALDLMLQNYRDGYVTIKLISTSEIDIGAGGVMLQNAGGSVRLMVANTSISALGPTNIDTGSISASATYYIYAYATSVTATGFSVVFSTSSTSPTGITYYQQIGSFKTDGSSNFIYATSNVNTQIGFGAWQTRTVGTIYQASTDGIVMASGRIISSGANDLSIYTDSNSSPSTERSECATSIGGDTCSVISPVRKGDYYVVNQTNDTALVEYFISLGS